MDFQRCRLVTTAVVGSKMSFHSITSEADHKICAQAILAFSDAVEFGLPCNANLSLKRICTY